LPLSYLCPHRRAVCCLLTTLILFVCLFVCLYGALCLIISIFLQISEMTELMRSIGL